MMKEPKSDFARRVVSVVRRIPRGKTLTYQQVARRAGRPRAYRAVGNIMNHWGMSKTGIPCHRVVRSDLPAPRSGIHFVYAILCGNGAVYIGQTQNLQRRWIQHSNGTASHYTKRYGAERIIHYERRGGRKEAAQREKWLKTGFGRKWLKREWKAGRTRQAGGTVGGYAQGPRKKKELLRKEGVFNARTR